ncbi:MAG: tripartite tricarboxylate transporter TctB family protein, partial [Deltaproteobacteria bacterium]
GTLRNPGPGFLPLMMALLLISFSLYVLARGLMGPERLLKGVQWRSQGVLVASVFLYGLLLDLVGFLLSAFVLMFVLFGLFFEGKGRWPRVFVCAVVTALIGWLVFSVALKVPFPRGYWMAVGR